MVLQGPCLYAALFLLMLPTPVAANYDLVVRNGTVLDGLNNPPVVTDVALLGDRIVAVGDIHVGQETPVLDATGLFVVPGFINMLSWGAETFFFDGSSESDLRQGVTLQVFGEGWSLGPLSEAMMHKEFRSHGQNRYGREWSTFKEGMQYLEERGLSTNFASFVGASQIRVCIMGSNGNQQSTLPEQVAMANLARQAMDEGALGIGVSLAGVPGCLADTQELTALAHAVAEYDGLFSIHLRSEADRLGESVEELIRIVRDTDVRAEIYHLKAAGRRNHCKLAPVLRRLESARSQGLEISANIYVYEAALSNMTVLLPPTMRTRNEELLRDAAYRTRLIAEMREPTGDWDNLLVLAGAENIVLGTYKGPQLARYSGKSVADAAIIGRCSHQEIVINAILHDRAQKPFLAFLMSTENLDLKVRTPWITFCSDAASMSLAGSFVGRVTHPRTFGNFARVIRQYVFDRDVISIREAVYRLTGLPAHRLRLSERGRIAPGAFADIALFDPVSIRDNATYEEPATYATGFVHVFVNGEQVIRDGRYTGAAPGRFLGRRATVPNRTGDRDEDD